MKNKNLKTIIMTLVTLLLVCGMNAVYAGQGGQGPQVQLVKASPNPVLEREIFTVTVRDLNGNPKPNIYVWTDFGASGHTNANGQISFTAPFVNADTNYIIYTQDYGQTTLKVRAKVLYMNYMTVDEGANFKEYVYDQDGHAVSGALVNFLGTLKLTGSNGYTGEYTAPWVYGWLSVFVSASKLIYNSAQSGVAINNNNDPSPVPVTAHVNKYSDGSPLQGATVSANTDGHESGVTNSEGICTFSVQLAYNGQLVTFTASHSGYTSDTASFNLYENVPQSMYFWLKSS
jgi:hypothetical protein